MDLTDFSLKEFLAGLAIFRGLAWFFRNCWPFIVVFVLWPDINNIMSSFSWWRTLMSSTNNYILLASSALREIPLFGSILSLLDKWTAELRLAIIRGLS